MSDFAPEAIAFPDPLKVGLDVLRTSAMAEIARVRGFGTEAPDDLGSPDFPGLPYVALELTDVDTSEHPFRETAAVQVTVWAETKAQALRLCQVCRAALVAYPGDRRLSAVRAGRRGPVPATDPLTRLPMAFTSVSLRLRPEPLDADTIAPPIDAAPSGEEVAKVLGALEPKNLVLLFENALTKSA